MNRATLLAEISRRLGRRDLVWAGIRGDDIEPLADLPQLAASFSIIGAYAHRVTVDALSYESLSGRRVDLETWDIDEHPRAAATVEFRRALLAALGRPSALLPYRASRFLSALALARDEECLPLGLFGAHQAAFEHKPWVESAVRSLGRPVVPWTYVAADESLRVRRLLRDGPVVLRRSRSSGGEGIARVDSTADLARFWPAGDEGLVSAAPYLSGAIPVNVGATVWRDGVTVHHPSVQLIGVPECVTRPLGYCGNDFGAARDLDPVVVDDVERTTVALGGWLRSHGYLGTFGVDFLVHSGRALFAELNARFQGSTHASCQLAVEADEPCLMLEHVAAFLGLAAPPVRRPLRELVSNAPTLAHVVVHWTGGAPQAIDPSNLVRRVVRGRTSSRVDVRTTPALITEPGGVVARVTVRERITRTGFDLAGDWPAVIGEWQRVTRHDQTEAEHVPIPG